MSAPATIEKDKILVYLDPKLGRLLRLEKAETRRPISDIVEGLVRDHFAIAGPPQPNHSDA